MSTCPTMPASCYGKNYAHQFILFTTDSDHAIRLSRRFPDLLRSASLTPVSSKNVDFYYGSLVEGKTGIQGAPMEPYMNTALDIFVMAFDEVTKLLLAQGKLEIPKDHKITTEENRKQAVADIATGIREKGCFEHLSEWVAQKQV
jgi:hypothetical protein